VERRVLKYFRNEKDLNKSIVYVLNKIKSIGFRKVVNILKWGGLRYQVSLKIKKIRIPSLRSINYSVSLFDNYITLQTIFNTSRLLIQSKRNLKCYLYDHFIPSNGQSARSNGKTSKFRPKLYF